LYFANIFFAFFINKKKAIVWVGEKVFKKYLTKTLSNFRIAITIDKIMYIQIEETPNHNALKFLIEGLCKKGSILDFEKDDTEEKPKFVQKIFEIEGVIRVFITEEFITITKKEEEDFETLKPSIFEALFEAQMNKEEVGQKEIDLSTLDEISKQIVEILDERIKPAVAMDGGDISFVKFEAETGVVYVKMKGSCSGCPSSTITLQQGIKRTLQHYIPEVYDVASV
jgi:Fe-S cluster biogenesis protein NfuA